MEKRFQVFISSTYEDLIAEREIVSVAILRSHNIPSGMELSSGANARTLDIIYRWIDDCDFFILLLGGRYGSVNDPSGLSYTELEYDYARAHSKPIIVLWLTDEYIDKKILRGSIAVRSAYERVNVAHFGKFKEKVTRDCFCVSISDVNELESKVFAALDSVRMSHSLGGWIRTTSILELVLDHYAQYINCYLDILRSDSYRRQEIEHLLRILSQIVKSFICDEIGWLDVMVPVHPTGADRRHLLIEDAPSRRGWLRVAFSSIPRTNEPTLIPIEINDRPWRGSGNAYASRGVDYVSSFEQRYSREDYALPPELTQRLEEQYAYWRTEHYFSALLAVAIVSTEQENVDALGVLNLNFTAEDPLGANETLSPQRSLAIMSVLDPALHVLSRAITHNRLNKQEGPEQ